MSGKPADEIHCNRAFGGHLGEENTRFADAVIAGADPQWGQTGDTLDWRPFVHERDRRRWASLSRPDRARIVEDAVRKALSVFYDEFRGPL